MKSELEHVPWSRNACIYEVNLRHFSKSGTINAFVEHLPRLRELGVTIIWFMPIQPIGVENRKGELGSNYSIRDYTTVNPNLGTLEDFRNLVASIHEQGMYVLLDWVANHTAWDHEWVKEHPEWYKKDKHGAITGYVFDKKEHGHGDGFEYWTDVVGLDYREMSLWPAMTAEMEFWIRETDIDGFRCDVAGLVPTAFWEQARKKLEQIKPVFMLAEWSTIDLHRQAFDMTYDWNFFDVITEITKGKKSSSALTEYVASLETWPRDAYRMLFITNHDKNSWEGSDKELYGKALAVCIVLSFTLPGMPLIYNGQESGLDKRLSFFSKSEIIWGDYPLSPFYRQLIELKRSHPVLWNGTAGGKVEILPISNDRVFAFSRRRLDNYIQVVVNLSDSPTLIKLSENSPKVQIPAWGYLIRTNDRELAA